MKKTKGDSKTKLKNKGFKYIDNYIGHQSPGRICQTSGLTGKKEIIREERKRRKNKSSDVIFCRFCYQGSKRADQG